jgi:inner membrane protein
MASPVGHALAGWIGYQLGSCHRPGAASWCDLALCLAAANLADADFLPGLLLGTPDRFHHGVSHSFGAAVLVATAVWGWGWWRAGRRPAARALLVGGLYLSHVLIDWMTIDGRPPIGVPFFWPCSDSYLQCPVPVFLDIQRVAALTWPVLRHNLTAVLLEIAILLPPGLALMLRRRRCATPAGGGGQPRTAAR